MECPECGTTFELSARNVRAARVEGRQPKCRRCRSGARPPKATEAMRRWWLDRFSLQEIRELAAGVWPDDAA